MTEASCAANSFCTTHVANSECSNGVCDCVTGYKASEDKSSCIDVRIGYMTCSATSDCTGEITNSVCTNGVCQCSTGYSASTDSTACGKWGLKVLAK